MAVTSDKASSGQPMSDTTSEESPLRRWLVDRGASQLFNRPIADIESVFIEVFLNGSKPAEQSIYSIESAANASYAMTHNRLAMLTSCAVKVWHLDPEKEEDKAEAIQILFNFETIWDPILHIYEGTEEMEAPIFEEFRYWPDLRRSLGYEDWDEQRLRSWERLRCASGLWRINEFAR